MVVLGIVNEMIVRIQLLKDDGTVVVEHQADAMKPTQYQMSNYQPIGDDGKYKLFRFVYQPVVAIMPFGSEYLQPGSKPEVRNQVIPNKGLQ